MKNFNYYNPAEIIFGNEAEKKIKDLLNKYNVKSLLLLYSGDFIKDLGIWDEVHNACEELNINFYENGNIVPNPKVELVRELVTLGKEKDIDFVLAVGGGSAIDTAKAVSIGIPYDKDVWDFYIGESTPYSALPIGVISTLPSSGSETSNASIISSGIHKLGVETDLIIPKFAIMNPKYTLTLPLYQTSCGLADILSHLLERYFTNTDHVDTTDFLIEGAIKALILNASRLMKDPENYNARAEVQWLASIAHNNLLDTGRESDWGSHRIEHEISAQYNVTHGEGMAIIFTAFTRYAAKHNPDKLAQLANRVFTIDYHNYTTHEMAEQLSDALKQFFISLNLKTSLKELNITDEHFEEMAMRATKDDTCAVGHYIPLNKDKIIEILNIALNN
jgi:alcohol dehydrogenase YqhD (iron-dependent ADH family)